MAMIHQSAVRVVERSNIAEARRESLDHAERLGWSETDRGNCAIVATELATNLVKHARDGIMALYSGTTDGSSWMQLVAVDHGPGIADVEKSFSDGYSTAGSPGTGLGAVRRLTTIIDVFSTDKGTVLAAEMRRPSSALPAGPLVFGAFAAPKEGEATNGDRWDCRVVGQALAILVCDGLGHGFYAGQASSAAVDVFRSLTWSGPKNAVESVNDALRPTRGAAAAIALVDPVAGRLRYCGIGNIAASIVDAERVRHLVSQNGILGHSAARITEFEYPWSPHSTLVMTSDGVSSRWRPDGWPGLWQRHPGVIAGTLFRDFARGNDDVVVVAVRHA